MSSTISPPAQPVIIGIGQVRQRTSDLDQALEPLRLIEQAARAALADPGVALPSVDTLLVVNQVSWLYDDLPRRLALRLGLSPALHGYSSWGGHQPTRLLERAARRIAAGKSRVALVCGGEALRSRELFAREQRQPSWTPAPPQGLPADVQPIDPQTIVSPLAWQHGLRLPINVYPLYENRLRHTLELSAAANQRWSAELWAALSRVAAQNPAAWQAVPLEPEQIMAVSAENRMICYPYPKLMNALLHVDQAAAVVLTDTDTARQLGVPEERWVYVWGGRCAHDQLDILARPCYERSRALELVLDEALALAGRPIEQIELLELYSCFPCLPKLAICHLRLAPAQPISVTGGLTFFGGPGNNYMLHAAVAMAARLRCGVGQLGLLYGQGGYLTYHHALVLGRAPRAAGYAIDERAAARQAQIDAVPTPPLAVTPAGRATVETYTVSYDRAGEPQLGMIVGRLCGGERFVANTRPDDRASLLRLVEEQRSVIGAAGRVSQAPDGRNWFELDE